MDKKKLNELVLTALMIALVFVAGSIIKIQTFGGFIHLGDCMVLISVVVLGTYKGAVASSIGMALVDILGGYMLWAPFTFIIKGAMAIGAGSIINSENENKFKYLIGFIAGSIIMIIGYFFAGIVMAGFLTGDGGFVSGIALSLKDIPGNILQGVSGIVIATILTPAVVKAKKLAFR